MAVSRDPAAGGDPQPVKDKGEVSKVASPTRKHKAAAMRGAPPKRRKTDVVVEKPESSKANEEEKNKASDVQNDLLRNRASPSRLVTLNKELGTDQKIAIINRGWGGLLSIGATTMPADLSQWVMKCYDPLKSELVIPNRGRIPVDADSVNLMWGLPNFGLKVCWECNAEVTKAFNEEYEFKPGNVAPSLNAWCEMIKKMKGAHDEKFVRAWAVVAFDCFLAPTTGLKVSPRCYLAVSDLDLLSNSNICQFVVDQTVLAFIDRANKKSVTCCVYNLVMRYLDSLEVDEVISDCVPRINAWDANLVKKVMNKDKISKGVFGKLQLKEKFRDSVQTGLFGGLLKAEQFVCANLPANYDQRKKRKFGALLHGLCSEFEESLAKFVQGVGKLDECQSSGSRPTEGVEQRFSKKKRTTAQPKDKNERDVEAEQRPLKRQPKTKAAEKTVIIEDAETAESDEEESDDVELNDTEREDDARKSQGTDDEEDDDDAPQSEKSDDNDEDNDEDNDDEVHHDAGGGSNSKNDDDGDTGGNNGGTGSGEAADEGADNDTTSPADIGTRTVYYRTRSRSKGNEQHNTKGRADSTSGSSGEEREYSLLDMCKMDMRSTIPDIPLLEEAVVWDEDCPHDLNKLRHMFGMKQTSVRYELDDPVLHGAYSQGTYNEWFEESLGVMKEPAQLCSTRKTAATVMKEISARRVLAKQRDNAQVGADTPDHGQVQQQPDAYPPEKATPTVGRGTLPAYDETPTAQKAVIWDESPAELYTLQSIKTTSLAERATSLADEATPPTGRAIIWDESPMAPSNLMISEATVLAEKANIPSGKAIPTSEKATAVCIGAFKAPYSQKDVVDEVQVVQMPQDSSSYKIQQSTLPVTASYIPERPVPVPSRVMRSNLTVPRQSIVGPPQATSCNLQATTARMQASPSMMQATTSTTETTSSYLTSEVVTQHGNIFATSTHNTPSGSGTFKAKFSQATKQTCPPPPPAEAKRSVVTAEDLANILQKIGKPSNMNGSSEKRKSAPEHILPTSTLSSRFTDAGFRDAYLDAPDAPGFNLGLDFDTPPETHTTEAKPAATAGIGDSPPDSLYSEELEILCLEAEKESRLKAQQTSVGKSAHSPSTFETPVKQTDVETTGPNSDGTGSSSGPPQHARRVIVQPAHMQSYVNEGNKKQFACSTEVNRLYALVLLHGRKYTRSGQIKDESPPVVNYNDFPVTLKELSESVKPGGWLHTSVMEIGIQAINNSLPANSKKVIMPLRIATRLQRGVQDGAEISKLFSKDNRLDKKDMIMLPVIQPLDTKSIETIEPVNHYFLFNLNIRDRKYQVLDSLRTLKDRSFKFCVLKIISVVRALWEKNYKKSKISLEPFGLEEIPVPRQTTNHDCGICTLANAQSWEGRQVPAYTAKEIPNMRKLMNHSWLTSVHNKAAWRDAVHFN